MKMRSTVGLVDAHSHLRSTAITDHGVPGSCLEEAILRMNAMTGVDPFDDAFVASSDLLSLGITGVQVIFHTFGTMDQYLDTLAKSLAGIRKSGIRARVVLAITDQFEFLPQRLPIFGLPDFVSTGPRMLPESFIELFEAAVSAHRDFEFGIGPVAPQWCSDPMLEAIGEKARSGIRIHTHCLESSYQRNWIAESPVARLERFGLLGKTTSLAHAIWLNEEELELVAARGAQLVTCPRSNQILKSGTANLASWINRKIDFAIGIDSVSGVEAPLSIARLSLNEELAEYALTEGGRHATGLDTNRDEVTWSDWDSGRVEDVKIAGKSLLTSGELHFQEEVEAARFRINQKMSADKGPRETRQQLLSKIMVDYLEALK